MIFFISFAFYLADLLISAITHHTHVVLFTTWYASSLFAFPRARALHWTCCLGLLADLSLRGTGSFLALGCVLALQLSAPSLYAHLKNDPLVYSVAAVLIALVIVGFYPVAWTLFTIAGILGLPVIFIYNRV